MPSSILIPIIAESRQHSRLCRASTRRVTQIDLNHYQANEYSLRLGPINLLPLIEKNLHSRGLAVRNSVIRWLNDQGSDSRWLEDWLLDCTRSYEGASGDFGLALALLLGPLDLPWQIIATGELDESHPDLKIKAVSHTAEKLQLIAEQFHNGSLGNQPIVVFVANQYRLDDQNHDIQQLAEFQHLQQLSPALQIIAVDTLKQALQQLAQLGQTPHLSLEAWLNPVEPEPIEAKPKRHHWRWLAASAIVVLLSSVVVYQFLQPAAEHANGFRIIVAPIEQDAQQHLQTLLLDALSNLPGIAPFRGQQAITLLQQNGDQLQAQQQGHQLARAQLESDQGQLMIWGYVLPDTQQTLRLFITPRDSQQTRNTRILADQALEFTQLQQSAPQLQAAIKMQVLAQLGQREDNQFILHQLEAAIKQLRPLISQLPAGTDNQAMQEALADAELIQAAQTNQIEPLKAAIADYQQLIHHLDHRQQPLGGLKLQNKIGIAQGLLLELQTQH